MKIYDYIIVGGGPCGITLATMLASTRHKTLLIESDSNLGGNWRVDLNNEGLMTEHSPKVLFSNNHYFYQLLKHLGVKYKLKNIYNDLFGNLNMIKVMMKAFSLNDYYKLMKSLFIFVTSPSSFNYYISMYDWMNDNDISSNGQSFLETIAVVMANTSDKICMGAFFEYILIQPGIFFNIVEMEDPIAWLDKSTHYIKRSKNIDLKHSTHIVSVYDSKYMHILRDTNDTLYHGKRIVFCVPVKSFYDIVSNSSNSIQKNWFNSMTEFKSFIDHSSYIGLGFQLHFDKVKIFPSQWCWSCFDEWKIIVLKKAPTTWSCVIVDLETKSNAINKTANECDTMDDIIEEGLRQLSVSFGSKLDPIKVTYHKNIKRKNNKWDTINSSYGNSIGALPYKGKHVKNVFTIGPHNMGSFATIEQAVQSAIIFGNEMKINNVFTVRSENYLSIMLYLVIAYIAIYLITYKM